MINLFLLGLYRARLLRCYCLSSGDRFLLGGCLGGRLGASGLCSLNNLLSNSFLSCWCLYSNYRFGRCRLGILKVGFIILGNIKIIDV
jgi:hypothetical protein